jgi:hypothetical protein
MHSLGIPDVQSLRDLAVNLKRCGIYAAQCAQGFRILNIMKKSGVNQNKFESFMREVYGYCERSGLAPQDMASNLQALINLSKEIPFANMPDYIKQKKNEITQLKQNIAKLHRDIKTLEESKDTLDIERSAAKELRYLASQEQKTITAELKEYSNRKAELEKYGLDIDEDFPKFVKLVESLREYGFNVKEVISEFQDLHSLKLKLEYLQNRVNQLVNQKMSLERDCAILKHMLSVHSQKLSYLNELESMGFGFNNLRLLYNTIREIAAENDISYRVAIQQLFKWIEKQYGGIKLRQNIQDQKHKQKQPEYIKPDNLTTTYPYYPDVQPFTASPERSTLEEQKRQRQRQIRSIYYEYRETNTKSNTTRQEDNQLDNGNHDGDIWDG